MVKNGRRYAMPATVGSLLTTGLVGASAKLQGAKLFARLGTFDCEHRRRHRKAHGGGACVTSPARAVSGDEVHEVGVAA